MREYLDLVNRVLKSGESSDDRTGVGTTRVFGEIMKFDLRSGFPAITTKKLAWKSVVSELLWFLKGSTDVNELRAILHGEENRNNPEKGTIWDANYLKQAVDLGYDNGYLGPIYGYQWRNYNSSGIDQVADLLEEASINPESRRLLVTAWNPQQVHEQALPPCHYGFQVIVRGEYIDLLWNQRSMDVFLGAGFNIASYGLLLEIFARILGKKAGYLTSLIGDCHIYNNHMDQLAIQLDREPKELPELWINPDLKTLEDFENATIEDFKLLKYSHWPALLGKMAV